MDRSAHYIAFLNWLARERARLLGARIGLAGLRTLAVLAAIAFGAVLLGTLPIPAEGLRWAAMAVAAAGVAALFLWPLLFLPGTRGFARMVDQAFPELKDAVINTLELGARPAERARLDGHDPAFVQALVADTHRRVENLEIGSRVRPRGAWRWAGVLGGSAALTALLLVVTPGWFGASARRLLNPREGVIPFGLLVTPGDLTVAPGEDVQIDARVRGAKGSPKLWVRGDYEAWHEATWAEPARAMEAGWASWKGRLASLQRATRYRVEADGHRSGEFSIRLREPVAVLSFDKRVEAPSYSGSPVRESRSATGELDGLRGSRATLRLETSGELRAVSLDGVLTGALEREDAHHYRIRVALTAPGDYRVRLTGADGQVVDAGPYPVSVAADELPHVTLLQPARDAMLPPHQHVAVTAMAGDDFGLSKAELVVQPAEGVALRIAFPLVAGSREAGLALEWDASPLNLEPGQTATLWVEVRDNDGVGGPKLARSESRTLRVATLAEMFKQNETELSDKQEDLAQAAREQRELKTQLEEAAKAMRQSASMSWEQKKELESTLKRQQELARKISDVSEQVSRSMDKMEQQNQSREEVLRKMEELRNLMKELDSEALRKAMEKMQEALKQADPEQVKQAMQNLKVNEQDMLTALERTIQELKQLQKAEQLNAATKLAEELARQQKELADQIEKAAKRDEGQKGKDNKENKDSKDAKGKQDPRDSKDSKSAQQDPKSGDKQDGQDPKTAQNEGNPQKSESAQMAQQQQELKQKADQLAKQVEQLQKDLAQQSPKAGEKLQQAQKEMQQNASPQMDQSSQSLQKQEDPQDAQQQPQESKSSMAGAKKHSRQAQQSMEKAASGMRAAQQMMQQDTDEELAKRVREAAQDLVGISGKQQTVNDATQPPVDLARQQQSLLDGTTKVVEKLQKAQDEFGPLPPDIGRGLGQTLHRMQGSRDLFETGNPHGGRAFGGEALLNLNKTILGMLDAAGSMCNKGGSGKGAGKKPGPQQQMSGLSQQQQNLNRATQQMMRNGGVPRQQQGGSQGQPSPQGPMSQASQLAAQQEAVRRGLEDLLKQQGDQRRLLGDISDVSDKMKRIAEDLANNRANEQTVDMQQKILSRMLDAQRSINRRDREPQRWSSPGQEFPSRQGPRALGESLTRKSQRNGLDLLRDRRETVPRAYLPAVERYFQSLPSSR